MEHIVNIENEDVAMLDHQTWTFPPQIKDLPREAKLEVTCRSCGLQWGESVREMIARDGSGAEFVDLLEWQYRCADEACGGAVRFHFDCHVAMPEPVAPRIQALARPKITDRPVYPVKAVVKPRDYPKAFIPANRRQLSLPLVRN
jgi:hypothetical protein